MTCVEWKSLLETIAEIDDYFRYQIELVSNNVKALTIKSFINNASDNN